MVRGLTLRDSRTAEHNMSAEGKPQISLSQFAAVQAGELDSFSLGEVLEAENIPEAAWYAGREHWLGRIATEPETHRDYETELAQAQDRLACDVSPLYDDAAAWGAYLRVGSAPGSDELTPGDMARLGRHWKRRFEEDDGAAKKAQAARQEDLSRLTPPRVTVGDRVLPNGATQVSGAQAVARPAASPEAVTDHQASELLELAAAMHAAIDSGLPEERIVARYRVRSLADAKRRVAAFFVTLKGPARKAYRSRVAHHRRVLETAQANAVRSANRPPLEPAPQPAPAPPLIPAPPVVLMQPPPPAAATSLPNIDETAVTTGPVDFGAPLPFSGERPPPPKAAADYDKQRDAPSVDETAEIDFQLLAASQFPFGERPSVDSTVAMDAVLPQIDDLPFAAGPANPPPAAAASWAAPRPTTDPLDETAALDLAMLRPKTLPFAKSEDAANESGESNADAGEPRSVRSDVVWYARYCAEVDNYGREPIGPRHSIATEAEHALLRAHWTQQLAAKAELRTQFLSEYKRYAAWLEEHMKKGKR